MFHLDTCHSNSLQETQIWVQKLTILLIKEFNQVLDNSILIGFIGNLGSGKTTLIQGILKTLHYKYRVTSPSYALVNEYPTNPPINHIDLYRLDQNTDWEEIGIDYYFNSKSICLIEWPERLPNYIQLNNTVKIEKTGEYSRCFQLV